MTGQFQDERRHEQYLVRFDEGELDAINGLLKDGWWLDHVTQLSTGTLVAVLVREASRAA